MTKIQEVEAQNLECLDFVKVESEKNELLEEYETFLKEEENISFKSLLFTFIVFFLILSLFLSKIYIANQIYIKSISLYKMENELSFLKAQKRNIQEKIQAKRYQLEIGDAK